MVVDERGLAVRPRPDGTDLRRVEPGDLGRCCDVLAEAFEDDPLFAWVHPDATTRRRRLRREFELWVGRIYLDLGECWTTDRFAGAAVWSPPDAKLSGLDQLRLLAPTLRLAGRDAPRMLRMLSTFARVHPRKRHWYLPLVGVASQWRGRGFGGALLRPVLERCDADGTPAYLEATSPRNRALYERHGFEVTRELRAAADAPPVWPMWREPA